MKDWRNYQKKIEQNISTFIDQWQGPAPLKEACAYSLQVGGKRFRPLLVYLVAQSLGDQDVSDVALAVELFHTASLIADDLPCMDNELLRRGKAALHNKFNEATALLATYALIASGYDCLQKNSKGLPPHVLGLAIASVAKNTGGGGATGGQYWDLFSPKEHMEQMIAQKTGALFELSFVLGWLYGGGEVALLPWVEKAAYHFGMAFQIHDDILDMEQDAPERNYACCFGKQSAQQRVTRELEQFDQCLALLPPVFKKIRFLLEPAPLLQPSLSS
ncbi:MAG: polyprenyl synthetase family protein [Verrucomicrobia bacterium]|nr:polyprenyl synthetase family protein [Verrucomicrobiota bacterium]MBS0646703.1 polyprenyl synthetase family protein [Verrucomicrobiota bacterium]